MKNLVTTLLLIFSISSNASIDLPQIGSEFFPKDAKPDCDKIDRFFTTYSSVINMCLDSDHRYACRQLNRQLNELRFDDHNELSERESAQYLHLKLPEGPQGQLVDGLVPFSLKVTAKSTSANYDSTAKTPIADKIQNHSRTIFELVDGERIHFYDSLLYCDYTRGRVEFQTRFEANWGLLQPVDPEIVGWHYNAYLKLREKVDPIANAKERLIRFGFHSAKLRDQQRFDFDPVDFFNIITKPGPYSDFHRFDSLGKFESEVFPAKEIEKRQTFEQAVKP